MHHALEEMRPRRVAYRYVRTWFAVDLVSTAISAFDLIEVADAGAAAAGASATAAGGGGGAGGGGAGSGYSIDAEWASRMKGVRVLRALKLVKLARLLRSSRIVRRWSAHFAIDQRTLAITQSLVGAIIFAHWLACFWYAATPAEARSRNAGLAAADI